MNTRVIPVTAALINAEERTRLEQIAATLPLIRLQAEDAETMGVLIYEPGESFSEDLPHIVQALESGQTEEVFLAGNQPNPQVLITAMRYGIREFLPYPLDEKDIRAAFTRTAMRRSLSNDTESRGKITTVVSAGRGLGNTTLATNVARAMVSLGGPTVLFDMATPRGEAPYFLDTFCEHHWGELTEDISRLDPTYLASVLSNHASGLKLLAAPENPTRPEPQVLFMLLEQLRQTHLNVVVDTTLAPGEQCREIESADAILLLTELSVPGLASASRFLTDLRGDDPDAARRVQLVAARHVEGGGVRIAEAQDILEAKFSWIIPDDRKNALLALNQGSPLVDCLPRTPAAKIFQTIAKKLVVRETAAKKSVLGVFSKLFRKPKADLRQGVTA